MIVISHYPAQLEALRNEFNAFTLKVSDLMSKRHKELASITAERDAARKIITKAQEILGQHLRPDGISAYATLGELLDLLDGPEARAALGDGGGNGEQIAKADKIVTALYRRFKDWSKRGFGPDDVTWCEVKSDVVELINASQAGEAIGLRAKLATVTAKRDAALEVLEFIRAHYDDEVMQRVDTALKRKAMEAAMADLSTTCERLLRAEIDVLRSERDAALGGVIGEVHAERERQKNAEGWTSKHDDNHYEGELAAAASVYAFFASGRILPMEWSDELQETVPRDWPWASRWWKPKNPRRDLVRAAALVVAEIERLDRAALKKKGVPNE